MEIGFTANDATVKLNKSLKTRDEVCVELTCERAMLPELMKFEALPTGTHFRVVAEPIVENQQT